MKYGKNKLDLLTMYPHNTVKCWSKRELNELAIVVAFGIDKIDEEYEITVQIVDPSEVSVRQASTQRSPVVSYHSRGETIFEAIRKMTTIATRKPYFAHLQVVVLGKISQRRH